MGINSTPQFTVSLVDEEGRKEWVLYDDLGDNVPAAIFPSRAQCERFIQTFNHQEMAMNEVTTLAKAALVEWMTDLAAKYGLDFKDLKEPVLMGVEDALREVLPA
jgi:hypothetical protein